MDPQLPPPSTTASAAAPTAVPFASSPPPSEITSNGHPSYAVMIKTALSNIKDKEGSSKRAIGKYIAENYSNLPSAHSSLLGTHLRRLKSNGVLEMVKKSYKLSKSDNHTNASASAYRSGSGLAADGSKRKRGRPSKAASAVEAAAQAAAQPMFVALGLVDDGPKKKRGRPRKSSLGVDDDSASVRVSGEKKRRGRPKKKAHVPVMIPYASEAMIAASSVNVPDVSNVPNVGGQDVPVFVSNNVGVANPNVGVASGTIPVPNFGSVHNVGERKRRGRPRKEAAGAGLSTGSRAGGSGIGAVDRVPMKRRGRPRRAFGAVEALVVPAKRRGRPARANLAAVNLIPAKRRGRPSGIVKVQKQGKRRMGRPKKNASTVGESSQAANTDLMRKLDYFQSKIREAVIKLTPHITSHPSMVAVAAIQELEGLAALDVSAPFGEVAQQPQVARD